jgi:hypothetical protein
MKSNNVINEEYFTKNVVVSLNKHFSLTCYLNTPSILFLPRQLMTELADRLKTAVAAPTIIEYKYIVSPTCT